MPAPTTPLRRTPRSPQLKERRLVVRTMCAWRCTQWARAASATLATSTVRCVRACPSSKPGSRHARAVHARSREPQRPSHRLPHDATCMCALPFLPRIARRRSPLDSDLDHDLRFEVVHRPTTAGHDGRDDCRFLPRARWPWAGCRCVSGCRAGGRASGAAGSRGRRWAPCGLPRRRCGPAWEARTQR